MPREEPARPALAHRLDGPSDVYRLTSIDVPEVTTGTVTTEVRCGACGQPFACVVESPQARIWRYRRWRLTFYGALVLAVLAAMAIALFFEPTNVKGAIGLGGLLAFTFGIVGGALGSASAELTRAHDGDEGVRLRRRRRPHCVRYAKDLSEDDQGNWHTPYVQPPSFYEGGGI